MNKSEKQLILAIDQGTTSSRAIVFDEESTIQCLDQMEVSILCPQSGWVEQSANEIWETVYETIKNVINHKSISAQDIKAIGITNQRETTIIWNKETGEPIYNAIVWQSRQSQSICEQLVEAGYKQLIQDKTGLIINPYFSGTKIRWILDHVDGAQALANQGKLLFGTVDSFLVWKLTEGKLHITDYSNASRTMLYNIHTLDWDQELLNILNIPASMLPKVVNSSEKYGEATYLKQIDPSLKIMIASMIGDQQASLFGHCCFDLGDVKNTYGTGCFMLMNTLNKPVRSPNGLLTTIAWGIDNKIEYALEGSVFVGGSAVQWLRDGMRMIKKSKDVELSSDAVKGSNGVYVVPAFVGLGTPYWDNDARGSVFGLTRATKREHFVNAVVESIAYQSKDVMEVMMQDAAAPIKNISVDGGASVNNYLMQFQADILNCKILRPDCLEMTGLGAAYLAGLAVGIWKNKNELRHLQNIDQIFMPHLDETRRTTLYKGWKRAVEATRIFKNI